MKQSKKKLSLLQILTTFVLVGVFAYSCSSTGGAGHGQGGDFYRDLRVGSWTSDLVADKDRIDEVINKFRMQNTPKANISELEVAGKVDTLITYGPGNWVHEFNAIGDEYFKQAEMLMKNYKASKDKMSSPEIAQTYLKAASYYTIAGFPYIQKVKFSSSADGIDYSIDQAVKAFAIAAEVGSGGKKLSIPVKGGKSFDAVLWLPTTKDDKNAAGGKSNPYPVVLMTHGSDQILTQTYGDYIKYLAPVGIAAISFNLPGYGSKSPRITTDSSVNHRAVLDYIKEGSLNKMIDVKRIGIYSKSFGGNAATKVLYETDMIKSAVISCGAVRTVFEKINVKFAPPMTIDAVSDRMGIMSKDELQKVIKYFSLRSKMVRNGLDIPVLAVGDPEDYISPVSDLEALGEISTQGQAVKVAGNEPGGHCPPSDGAMPYIRDFFKKTL